MDTPDEHIPVVFFSYSHTSEEHKNWVLKFAQDIVSQGVDVKLDVWELRRGQDVIDFMEEMVKNPEIDKVLIICERGYKEKADSRTGGAGIESQIISSQVYGDVKQDKFVPVLRERDNDGKAIVPVYLEDRYYIDFSNDGMYGDSLVELVREIFEKREHVKPPLGPRPSYLDDDALHLPTSGQWIAFRSAVTGDKSTAQGLFNTLLETLASVFDQFIHNPEDMAGKEIDDYVEEQIEAMTPLRDHIVEIIDFLALYKEEMRYYEKIHELFESLSIHTRPPEDRSSWREIDYDAFRFFIHELFLYTIAILIKHNRFKLVDYFLREQYFIDHPYESRPSNLFTTFNRYYRSLETNRRNKIAKETNVRRKSVTADFIHDRAVLSNVPLRCLVETDFVLYLRNLEWFPKLLIYRKGERFPLFHRSASEQGFLNLAMLLDIKNKNDLIERIRENQINIGLQRYVDHLDVSALINLKEMYDSNN